MQGTRRAASSPVTPRKMPRRGIGIIITPEAAIANGASDARILAKHIFPNMLSTLIVQATVTIPAAIIGEAVLSFLGLGVQSPATSWGVMLSDAKDYLTTNPRLSVYPGVAIFLCSLSFNLLGDGLRDILDPRTTR